MKKILTLLAPVFLFYANANAQLSPPGLGDTNDAFWAAIGVSQKVSEKNTSVTYVGEGRISGPESHDLMHEQSIFVVNEEMYHSFAPGWNYSYALSYRRQNEYGDDEVANEAMAIQQEFRLYARLSHTKPVGSLKWKNTIRQEARKFYTPDFNNPEDIFQLRTRLKTQLSVPLGVSSKVTGSAEALFSASDETHSGWGRYGYHESRFCLYYTYTPQSMPVTFDVGYMNDLMGYGHDVADAGYLAFDIVVQNPF